MKKVLLSIILIILPYLIFAQNQHLQFKGVPIDGTLNEYVQKMKNANFTYLGTDDGIAILSGDFAGYKSCIIAVSTLKQKDLVNRIAVKFPDRDTWSYLSGMYFSLKEMLTEKYGNPSDCVEKFQSNTQPKDDGSKMHEVKMDRCNYYSTFETDKGDIELFIEHDGVTSCYVILRYYDRINSDLIRQEAMNDL